LEKWGDVDKIHMEYFFTDGRIAVDEYNMAYRGKPKKADYLLLFKENIPLAIVEAKAIDHSADEGYSQAVDYARILDVPFAYATNGDDLIERDMISGLNKTMKISDFPKAEDLWDRYLRESQMTDEAAGLYSYPYYVTSTGKKPRYYQRIAINRAVKTIAEGKKRILIVMATGTGKTFTAFQIVYRFWKTRTFKKILYLADRNILIDQTMRKDFKPFADAMEKIDNKNINTSKEIFLGLYQQLKTSEQDYYKQLPRDFFDLVIIDECHRGSASKDSNWHDILTYFSSAIQLGMTATPKDGGIQEAIIAEEDAKAEFNAAVAENRFAELDKLRKAVERAVARREKAEDECNAAYFGNPVQYRQRGLGV
jgi:type I restriction enzyme R subunit